MRRFDMAKIRRRVFPQQFLAKSMPVIVCLMVEIGARCNAPLLMVEISMRRDGPAPVRRKES
jgi:hypothetical protein